MSIVNTSIVLDNITIENDHDLLQSINKLTNNELKLQFSFYIDDIISMFKFYLNKYAEHIEDIDNYDCISPEIVQAIGGNYFTLNIIDDEENSSDINFLLKEFKRYFGVDLSKDPEVSSILSILLMDCSDYVIENETIDIKIYYKSYINSWLKDFIEN